MIKRLHSILENNSKLSSNAAWIMSKTLYTSLLGFVIGAISARFLGPSNYGLLSYGTAYISICTAVSRLGMNNFIMNDVVKKTSPEGETIGSALILRICASIISITAINVLVILIEPENELLHQIIFLQSLAILLHSTEVFDCWFKAKTKAKFTSIAVMIAYTAMGVWRILLLANGATVVFFAASSSIEAFVAGAVVFVFFRFQSKEKLAITYNKMKSLLNRGKHMIITALGVSIYLASDKLMLKLILGESAVVGYYAVGITIASLWEFIPSAVIETTTPAIIRKRQNSKAGFIGSYQKLLLLISCLSIVVSILFTLFGDIVINGVYGDKFDAAIPIMKILIWSTGFSMIGTARGIWMIQEEVYRFSKYYIFLSVVLNLLLNSIFIPLLGGVGAAIATLITQVFSALIAPLAIKETREFVRVYFGCFKLLNSIRRNHG